jgi:hypothetical protein
LENITAVIVAHRTDGFGFVSTIGRNHVSSREREGISLVAGR